jgi:hypothetical protein
LAARQIHRPWSFEPVHTSLPSGRYRRTRTWTDSTLELAYDIGYLAMPERGDYGLADSPAELTQLVISVHADRGKEKLKRAGWNDEFLSRLLSQFAKGHMQQPSE